MARIAQDDDQLIVNRGNVDYCAKVSEVFPSVCDLEELEDTSLPWDDHDGGVWHVKEANGTVYVRNGPHKAYDVTVDAKGKVSWSEKGEISEIGSGEEVVFLTSSDATELFEDNKIRDWKFGELTDTSKVNIMYGLFYKCENFTGDVTGFDVSNVTTMRYMFWQCRKYYATDSELNSWDVSNVTDMSMMFRSCSYNKPLDNWNVSACTDMKWMFRDSSFNQDIGGWDVSNVESIWPICSTELQHLTKTSADGIQATLPRWDRCLTVTSGLLATSASGIRQRLKSSALCSDKIKYLMEILAAGTRALLTTCAICSPNPKCLTKIFLSGVLLTSEIKVASTSKRLNGLSPNLSGAHAHAEKTSSHSL